MSIANNSKKPNDFCVDGPFEHAGNPNDHDVHVILYHWATCPPCKAFVPVWKDEFLPLIKNSSRIYASTCERTHIPNEIVNIDSFPTIMIIYNDKMEKYEGLRTAKDLYDHLLQIVNKISKNNLDKFQSNTEQKGGTKKMDYYKYKYLKYKTRYFKAKKYMS